MQYIAIAVAPGIAICLYFFYKDIYNREPKLNLIMSFIFGMAAIIPAIYIESYFSFTADGTVAGVAFFSYVIVAFTEEFCKFIGLRFYAFRQKSFDEPLDGIIYGVLVSMGFATIENLLYVLKAADVGQGLEVGVRRMLLSVPAHATFGVVMGYFVGRAKFETKNSLPLLVAGIVSAALLHGTFDFCLFVYDSTLWGRNVGATLLVGGAITSFVISILLSRRLFRKQQLVSQQLFKKKNDTPGVGDS